MKFLTVQEFYTMPVYQLDNVTYHKIEKQFVQVAGERIGKKILEKHMEKTVAQLSAQSMVDIISCITIL